MAAIAGWSPSDIWQSGVTLRHLLIAHDTALLTAWDQTSNIVATIYNLTTVVINAASSGKAKAKPKTSLHFHPYRERKREGLKITPKDIETLRMMAGAMVRRR